MFNKSLFTSVLKFELMTQIRTKSFWLISLIPPLAMIVMFVVNYNSGHVDSVLVDNKTDLFEPIETTNSMTVSYGSDNDWRTNGYDACVFLTDSKDGNIKCNIISKNILLPVNQLSIKDNLEVKMAEYKLGVNLEELKKNESRKLYIELHNENSRYKLMGLSLSAVFLLYLIVLQFASSILRMIGKEKKNKICEILLSAMSSKMIMSGKLVACLIAALLQMTLWCIIAVSVVFLSKEMSIMSFNNNAIETLRLMITSVPFTQLVEFVVLYVMYLVGGFMLYSILFSIIGAISNENTNTQQFSLIVTMPLLLSFVYVIKDFGAESNILTSLSYIPLSSPIASIPIFAKQGVTMNIILSLLILYLTIYFAFRCACVLYDNGALATKNRVTLKTMKRWISKDLFN
ncbi:MAG: ABC transporter permease [Bacteroidaceae bacterium]|nr:ABC transporter permease [Bacteroidaceae bacterium]